MCEAMSMKFWNVRRVAAVLLSVYAASAFAQSMADAHKAYVAGNWKEAADAYEVACPKEPDSLRAECYLWDILALSQTGNSKLFKDAPDQGPVHAVHGQECQGRRNPYSGHRQFQTGAGGSAPEGLFRSSFPHAAPGSGYKMQVRKGFQPVQDGTG